MVAALEKIFSFVKKIVSGIKNIFCVTKIIFVTSEKAVGASKKTVSVAPADLKSFNCLSADGRRQAPSSAE
jgi:hypothetical protein